MPEIAKEGRESDMFRFSELLEYTPSSNPHELTRALLAQGLSTLACMLSKFPSCIFLERPHSFDITSSSTSTSLHSILWDYKDG